MNGILELATARERVSVDTWVMSVPDEVCDREGLVQGTLVSMTINGGILTEVIPPPSEKLKEAGRKILNKDRELHERLRSIGD